MTISALEPPPEYASGHEVVVDNLSEFIEREQSIAAAAEANDHSRLQEFGVSNLGPDRSVNAYCDAAEQLRSDPVAPLTHVLYGTPISGIESDGSILPGSVCDLP